MFHIIGVDHACQSVNAKTLNISSRKREFAQFLKDAIRRISPTLVAEEHHGDWLGSGVSIAQALALEARVEHLFCDPGKAERALIGYRNLCFLTQRLRVYLPNLSDRELVVRATAIEMAREFPKREEFWLKSLRCHDSSRTIFVCGDAHVDGFTKRLADDGYSTQILIRGMGMGEYDRKLIAEAQLLLSAEPLVDIS